MNDILHILDHSLPLHSGYTFRTRAIMKAQIKAGWKVAGITGVRQYQNGQILSAKQEEVEGLHFFRTMAESSGPFLWREWNEVSALRDAIVKTYNESPFRIVHAHSPALNGLAAALAAAELNIPFIYEIRAFWEDAAVGNGTGSEGNMKYRLTRALEDYVISRADHIAVICEGLKSDLIRRGISQEKITISPNGVDMSVFGSAKPCDNALFEKLQLRDSDVIGFIGSFYDYEGLDDLITAMPILRAKGRNAKLVLVGGGPMEDVLRAQAQASDACEHIHFLGRVPHEEVEKYYSVIDVLAYPRKNMRLTDLVTPLKPLEAMAQEKLVAASDVGGHKELITDGETGTLFAADDPNSIADALYGLFSNKEKWPERRRIAKDFVKKQRNWEINIRRYDPVYHFLLGKDKPSKVA